MEPVITIIAITNGVQYLYKFIKVAEIYFSSVEIYRKISPKDIYRHGENASNLYEATNLLLAYNQPKLINNKNKKSIPINSKTPKPNMSKKLYKFALNVNHYYYIKRLEKNELRRKKHSTALYEERLKREQEADKENEKTLYDKGYLRDKNSRYYISSAQLLTDISTVVTTKCMADPKFSLADKEKLKSLITDSNALMLNNASEFERFQDCFYSVELLDRHAKRLFECTLLGDELPYSINTILMLQKHKANMSVRESEEIERNFKCVS
jgi:hypothetical protein